MKSPISTSMRLLSICSNPEFLLGRALKQGQHLVEALLVGLDIVLQQGAQQVGMVLVVVVETAITNFVPTDGYSFLRISCRSVRTHSPDLPRREEMAMRT